MPLDERNQLGAYLRDRRGRLDPASLGFGARRRRTPGLRREEVAHRANISATWYTWLEQGRGGAPSPDVLDRIGRALLLTDVEREHLFLIALGRPPEVHYQAADGVTPRLQRVLDALALSPALVKNATWDIIAWNRAAELVLADYSGLPREDRNILRLIFCDPRVRARMPDWEADARFVVAVFRAEAARAGASDRMRALVEDIGRRSPDFAAMWADNDVRLYGEGTKRIHHEIAGPIAMEYSAFTVDGRPDLSMVVYNPESAGDAERIRNLIKTTPR